MTPEEKRNRHNIVNRKYKARNRLKIREQSKLYNREQRKVNLEYVRNRHRNWYKNTIKERKLHEKTAKYKDIVRKATLKWRKNNIRKLKAVRAVYNAFRRGDLKKFPCFCGEKKVEAHHEDYSKPLEVEWFCKKHHMEADILRRKMES
jgi:hypothetical protein